MVDELEQRRRIDRRARSRQPSRCCRWCRAWRWRRCRRAAGGLDDDGHRLERHLRAFQRRLHVGRQRPRRRGDERRRRQQQRQHQRYRASPSSPQPHGAMMTWCAARSLNCHDDRVAACHRHRHRAHVRWRWSAAGAVRAARKRRRRAGFGRADPGRDGACWPTPVSQLQRPRRDRLRPRPGRLHRAAHRLRGGAGLRVRRRPAGAARSTAWRSSPRTRARRQHAGDDIWVAMDARMEEAYAAHYRHDGAAWRTAGRAGSRTRSTRWRRAGARSRREPWRARRFRLSAERGCPPARRCALNDSSRGRRRCATLATRGVARRPAPRRCRGAAALPARQGRADDGGARQPLATAFRA